MKNRLVLGGMVGVALGLGSIQCQAAGDPAAGKVKFYTCEGCHSLKGYTNAYPTYHVPKIGGQYEPYVISALQAYKAGQRKHGSMEGNAGSMADQDMADIAAYVARFESKQQEGPVTGDPKAGKPLVEKCASCHGEDGNAPAPNFPRLAGQYESYLIKAMKDYQTGARNNSIMQSMVQGLDKEQIKNIAAYYASQKGLSVIPAE